MSVPRFDFHSEHVHPRDATPWWGVHAARYIYAQEYVSGRRVLDVACGTGYGLIILSKTARQVFGADLDFEAAKTASSAVGGAAGMVVIADGGHLPFADSSFEVVTSFETIEHLENRAHFVSELRRILISGGICLLSTPNANYTAPVNGKPHNPYHVHEYTPAELQRELTAHFPIVELRGQVLDRRYRISPFWDDQQRLSRHFRPQLHRLLWRVLHRLGPTARNLISHQIWRHSFFPTETDYHFSVDLAVTAPVLYAVCQTPVSPL